MAENDAAWLKERAELRRLSWQRYAEGFAAGIEAAKRTAGKEIQNGHIRRRVYDAIRALRPPAAPAESEVMQHSAERHHSPGLPNDKTPPLSASAPAGAPSEDELQRMAQAIRDIEDPDMPVFEFHEHARAAYMALLQQSTVPTSLLPRPQS